MAGISTWLIDLSHIRELGRDVHQDQRRQRVDELLTATSSLHQASGREDGGVPGNGWPRDVELIGNHAGGEIVISKQLQDLAPVGSARALYIGDGHVRGLTPSLIAVNEPTGGNGGNAHPCSAQG
jgi:hypothetical protein